MYIVALLPSIILSAYIQPSSLLDKKMKERKKKAGNTQFIVGMLKESKEKPHTV